MSVILAPGGFDRKPVIILSEMVLAKYGMYFHSHWHTPLTAAEDHTWPWEQAETPQEEGDGVKNRFFFPNK